MPVGKGSIQRANQIAKDQDLKTEEKVAEKAEDAGMEVSEAQAGKTEAAVADKKEGRRPIIFMRRNLKLSQILDVICRPIFFND